MRPRLVFLSVALSLALGCGAPIRLHGELTHPVTSDGWPLTLEHFPPASDAPTRHEPVIVCHGILANRTYLKIDEERSLVAQLARAGFDVWLMDTRGREDAGAPSWFFGERTYSYTIDDFILRDMDAVITHVLEATHAKRVVWVGHSLGGVMGYARTGTVQDARIARLVSVAGPGYFAPLSRNLLLAKGASQGLAALPFLPLTPFSKLEGYTGLPLSPPQVQETFSYAGNFTHGELGKLFRYTANNGSKAELRQILSGMDRSEFLSSDGKTSYSAGIANIRVPVLLVGGRRDQLADPLVMRRIFEAIPSSDKTLVIAGRAEGFAEDYGHTDLLVGENACREVVPTIVTWLSERDSR